MAKVILSQLGKPDTCCDVEDPLIMRSLPHPIWEGVWDLFETFEGDMYVTVTWGEEGESATFRRHNGETLLPAEKVLAPSRN